VSYLYLPFVFQGILMGIDEKLHIKRGLGLWERLGHPLDTLTVFVPLSYIAINDFSPEGQVVYISLALFSMIFITKDEFIHSVQCSPLENWLHSLLFVLHPLIFFSSGILWKYYPSDEFLSFQPVLVGAFMIYQISKWSIPWKKFRK
jgi:hypothetical protein